jgi:predicted dehydrogenase
LPEKFRVVSVCDRLERRCQEAVKRFGCSVADSLPRLLADPHVEVAVLALPSHLHEEAALQALAAGKDVIVEKPFATSVGGAERIVAAARDADRIVTCFHNLRFAPEFKKIRELLATGILGTPVQIRIAWHKFRRRWDWQTSAALGGGVLNNEGSHVVDQALQLFGEGQPRIECWRVRTPLSSGDAENHVKIVLHGEGRPLLDLEMSDGWAYPQPRWQVLGTRGGLSGTGESLEWKYLELKDLPDRPLDTNPTEDRSYNSESLAWKTDTWSFKGGDYYAFCGRSFYEDLYSGIRQTGRVTVTPEDLLRQLRVLEECRRHGLDTIV